MGRIDTQTDRRTLDSFINPARHTMRAVSITRDTSCVCVCGKVTYDVEPGLCTGSRVVGERVVGGTTQRLVTVVRRHVADV